MEKIWQAFRSRFLTRQFLVFGIIGGINTLISQGIYMVCVTRGMAAATSSLMGDALAMAFSYLMNMHFTYHQKPDWKSAVTFPLSYLPGISISALMVVIVTDWLHGPKIWAKLISLPIYVPINYLCMSFIVHHFGKKEEKQEG